MSRNDGTLSREKIDLLDRVGFKWQPYGHGWRENYLALIQFKERFGHCRVPQKWKENRKLATWVHTQRNRRKFGQLQADRVEALDKLGFNWTADVATWEDRFKQLCEYKERFGHTRVPVDWSENLKLGAWVVHQRQTRRLKEIRAEYERRLNEIGFEWTIGERNPGDWDRMFAQLQGFKDEHGSCQVPPDDEHRKLAEWCQAQRRRFRIGRLLERRRIKLNDLGFEWLSPAATDRWSEMFRRLSDHSKQTGSCNFENCDQSSRPLRNWCTKQRKLHRLGLLSGERVSMLNALGFVGHRNKDFRRQNLTASCRHQEHLGSKCSTNSLNFSRFTDTTMCPNAGMQTHNSPRGFQRKERPIGAAKLPVITSSD